MRASVAAASTCLLLVSCAGSYPTSGSLGDVSDLGEADAGPRTCNNAGSEEIDDHLVALGFDVPRAVGRTGFLFSSCMSADPDRCATVRQIPDGLLVRLSESQN